MIRVEGIKETFTVYAMRAINEYIAIVTVSTSAVSHQVKIKYRGNLDRFTNSIGYLLKKIRDAGKIPGYIFF